MSKTSHLDYKTKALRDLTQEEHQMLLLEARTDLERFMGRLGTKSSNPEYLVALSQLMLQGAKAKLPQSALQPSAPVSEHPVRSEDEQY